MKELFSKEKICGVLTATFVLFACKPDPDPERVDVRVDNIYVDMEDNIWVACEKGLYRFDGTSFLPIDSGIIPYGATVNEMAFEESGFGSEIWIANSNGATVVSTKNVDAISSATTYTSSNSDLANNLVTSVYVADSSVRWFGTQDGLSVFAGSTWEQATPSLLPESKVNDIADSKQGYVFVGTDGGGLARLQYDEIDGITGASVWEQPWSDISFYIYDIYVDADSVQWFATNEGLAKHEGNKAKENWTIYSTQDGLPTDELKVVFKDESTNNLWIGTDAGLSVLSGDDTFTNYSVSDGLVNNIINTIAVDASGNIWVGSNGGISVYNGNSFIEYTIK